jgi:outer membrane receptor for Fe3+-dicitrate
VFKSSADRIVHSASFTNMTLTYRFRNTRAGQVDTYLNVSNIFDKDPPPAALGNAGTQSDPGRSDGLYFGDDPMGRAFNLGVRVRL